MFFEIIGEISNVERIAVGASIRDLERLRKSYVRDVGESSKELL